MGIHNTPTIYNQGQGGGGGSQSINAKDYFEWFYNNVAGDWPDKFIFKAELVGNILVMHFDTNYQSIYLDDTLIRIKESAPIRFGYKFSQYCVGYSDGNFKPNDRLGTIGNWTGSNGAFSDRVVKFYSGSQVRYWEADISVIVDKI